jgi:hypothetical protein
MLALVETIRKSNYYSSQQIKMWQQHSDRCIVGNDAQL